MLRSILVLALAMAAPAFAANELDQDAAIANYIAKGKELPGAFVIRSAQDGSMAVAPLKDGQLADKLTPEQIAQLKFVPIKGKSSDNKVATNAATELNADQARESWVAWGWGGWRGGYWGAGWGWGGWSYPSYWGAAYGAVVYPYAPVVYNPYVYAGYGYVGYRPCW